MCVRVRVYVQVLGQEQGQVALYMQRINRYMYIRVVWLQDETTVPGGLGGPRGEGEGGRRVSAPSAGTGAGHCRQKSPVVVVVWVTFAFDV